MERHRPSPDRGWHQGPVRVSTSNTQQRLSTSANQVQSSNEPDNPSEANLTPSQSVKVYKTYMQPYFGTVQLGTPAVTNGGGQAGLAYLDTFVSLCTGCTFNFVNVHFFIDRSAMDVSQYLQAFKDYVDISVPEVQAKHTSLSGLPIAVGEVSIIIPIFPRITPSSTDIAPSSGSPAPRKTKRAT